MAKRGNNEGSVQQLPSGSWRAQLSVNGFRLGHTEKTRAKVNDWLRKTQSEIEGGLNCDYAQFTYEDFLDSWLTSIKPSLRSGTWYQYEMTCRRHILPYLGKYKLINLKPEHIQNLINKKLQSGTGVRTIEVIHTIIHNSLNHAIKIGAITRNPTNATTVPRQKTHEMKIFNEIEVNTFLNHTQGTRYESLYHLAIATGLRQSELLGLKWSDLDWEKKSLNVQRQLKRKHKQGDYFESPKTRNGRRSITLGTKTIQKLREQLKRQIEERDRAGNHWQENDLIFPSTIGTPMGQNNLFRSFKVLLRTSGLPEIRFHDLRHTAASLMLMNGVSPIIVAKRLGHSKISMTLDVYGHLIPEMQNKAAELIDELITPIPIELHTGCTRNDLARNDTPHI